VNTAMLVSTLMLLLCSLETRWKDLIPIDENLGRTTPQELAIVVGKPKTL